MYFIGLDAGSVSVKLVVLDPGGNKLHGYYERHKGLPLPVALKLLKKVIEPKGPGDIGSPEGSSFSLSITGSAGRLIASVLGIEPVNEIVAQAFSTRRLFPHIRTIIEMGGEDSKLILLGGRDLTVKDFSMNSVCAAGTGSFLDQQAERLRLTIEEFSELALKSKKPPRIAGRCSVFAKSDMIHLQQIATPVEDIVAGLCFAVARNFKGSISRGRKIITPVSFQGGVAANKGLVRAFREIFGLEELFVPGDHALMGALGAALKGIDEGAEASFDIRLLEEFVRAARPAEEGYEPLSRMADPSSFSARPSAPSPDSRSMEKIRSYLGIDIGSISTNLAVIDEAGTLLAKRYLMTAGRPIEAVMRGLSEIGDEIGERVQIIGVGTTGSGRYMIADYVGADIVKNEITAQATAAAFIDKNVDTIFEIGGQDSKYISLQDGIIVDFEMNKACAAGTGSFLEEQAEKLNISVKGEFQERAFSAKNPCRLGERCTVFMENSLVSNLQRGAERDDLLAGLAYSIVQNYINKVVAGKKIGDNIFFQGGVAFNKSVAAAFSQYLGRRITIPPNHDVTGAIGMALIARDHCRSSSAGRKTSFKGFELSRQPYEVSSFECKGCPNVCEINRVKIAGEKNYLFYGGRCEKYDVKKRQASGIPDLFAFREELLLKEHLERLSKADRSQPAENGRIGIPNIFFFHDQLPFWSTLLWELGFQVEVSPKTNRQVINLGLERVLSEACFPIKVAHGHVQHLIEQQVDALFIPSFINLNSPGEPMERGLACPYTQTIPYVSKVAFEGIRTITPVVDMGRGEKYLAEELARAFGPFGLKRSRIRDAIRTARESQRNFDEAIRSKGAEVLKSPSGKTVVIIGRSYNALDSGMNLELPRKLADLGVLSVPFDFLPLERFPIDREWPNMYWRSGQRILKAARFVRETRDFYPIFIGNFLCGPDSFILKYFRKEMGDKPFLHIEIDEHSADAGAITRCEAFLDSIWGRDDIVAAGDPGMESRPVHFGTGSSPWTVYVPRMSEHAFALAAAFERCGLKAEVLPESDKNAADIGRKYVSGKECYPCTVTTGDMVRKILDPEFRRGQSAFFMPSGAGPCRFGQYNVFHRLVLDGLGYNDVPIYSPNQDNSFYRDLGIVGKDFSMQAWKGVIAFELLEKCLRETRPHEKIGGSADELYTACHKKLYTTMRSNGVSLDKVLRQIRSDFEKLPRNRDKKPLIGVIGEIFVRSHRFSNEDLVRKVEALGGEVWLAPVEEWIYYVNHTGLKMALLKKEKSAIINFLLKRHFQKRTEHKYAKYFKGFLKTLQEPDTEQIIEKAAPYLHSSFEGEAILSVGKAIDLLEKGAAGIINAMPFGCMPGTIVTALLRGINRDYGIPFISIPYDGTESLTTEIQLEAFMDQAKAFDNTGTVARKN